MKTTDTKVRISRFQLLMMLIAITSAFGHFVYVHIAIRYAGRDAWISLLIGSVLGMGVIYVQTLYATRQPELSLVAHTKMVLGKWVGSLITVIYILFFMFVVATTMKTVTDFMGIIYPTTPPGIFVFSIIGIATWASYKGLEVIVRTIQILLPLLILLGITASVLSSKDKNPQLLLPILNNGWMPILQGAIVFAAMIAENVVFTMFASYINSPQKLKGTSLLFVGVILVMFMGPVTGPIMLFGEHMAQALAFPTYTEIQYIHISNIVERLDIIGVLLWTVGSFFRISVFMFAACKGVAQLFDAKENDYTIPTAVFAGALTLSVMKSSREEIYYFLQDGYLWIVLIISVGIPLLTLCVSFLRRRSRARHSL